LPGHRLIGTFRDDVGAGLESALWRVVRWPWQCSHTVNVATE